MVGVNTLAIVNGTAPFVGIEEWGLGCERSKYGIEGFLEVKSICLAGM